jgi:lysyl-tRNA synthetase, class I
MAEKLTHWADQTAFRIIKQKGEKDVYSCAAGITPSGTIHAGNFREIITVELIVRALKSMDKNTRFIYSWDDYDVFRKVPKNMPNQEELQKFLRMPITDTPDTFDCKHSSFAEHNEKMLEKYLPTLGINPEFIKQSIKYKNCDYANEINTCLKETDKIKDVLNQYRKEPLANDWLPVSIFCDKCKKDTIEKIDYKEDFIVSYKCECGHSEELDIRKKGIIKLNWRIDWPMRWHYENLDCEPAGKDHFAAGGSRQSGVEIQKAIWDEEAPIGFMYEWIGIKGGGQFSSSSGNVVTLKELLEIYEPEIIRFMFAGTRPNSEFSISFDLDVIKVYEDFDKLERIYFGKEEISEKKAAKQKRIYELSCVNEIPKEISYQPSFRHLTNILQIHSLNLEKTKEVYKDELKNDDDIKRFELRAICAINWINKYAPEDFKFSIVEKSNIKLDDKQKAIFKDLIDQLNSKDWTAKDLHQEFYDIARRHEVEPKEIFNLSYQILIAKEKGPQLASFIIAIGKERVADIFNGLI